MKKPKVENSKKKKHKSALLTRYDESTKPNTSYPLNTPRDIRVKISNIVNDSKKVFFNKKRKFSLHLQKADLEDLNKFNTLNTKSSFYCPKRNKERPFWRTGESFRNRSYLEDFNDGKSRKRSKRGNEGDNRVIKKKWWV